MCTGLGNMPVSSLPPVSELGAAQCGIELSQALCVITITSPAWLRRLRCGMFDGLGPSHERRVMSKLSWTYDANAMPVNEAESLPWSDETTDDLKRALKYGDSIEEIAMFLQYSVETVRTKMQELGLSEPVPRRRPVIASIVSIDGHRRKKDQT